MSSSLPPSAPYTNYKFTCKFTADEEEAEAFNEMMHFLVNARSGTLFDTEEASKRRLRVIEKLNVMVKEWAVEVGTAKNVTPEELVDGGGIHIQIFGSTKLQVHNVDSDIDMLCVAPSYVTREDFFSTFCNKLSDCDEVENMMAIPEAYTPVIKFVIDSQPVDMVFASLQYSPIPSGDAMDVLEVKWLHGLDEQSVRSFNGVRVAEWIQKLVPDMESFKITLRLIKYWAKQRGLYSNILGFLGGVNYAILVALVCQSYENLSPYWLVRRFFDMYTLWSWPTPVMLRKYEDLEFTTSDGRYLPVWNPMVNFKDSLQIMPIITPAYPAMNSAYNVAQPQFRCVVDEFVRGHVLFHDHESMKGFPWEKLCESSTVDFFTKFPRYIQIEIKARTPEDHRIWFGWVESRIRLLILGLEQPPTIFSHPSANCFHRQPGSNVAVVAARTPSEGNIDYAPKSGKIINFELHHHSSPKVTLPDGTSSTDISGEEKGCGSTTGTTSATDSYTTPKKAPPAPSETNEWYISNFFIGISFRKDLRRVDLSFPIQDFLHKIMSWNQRKPDMLLAIEDCDSNSLPSFVYTVAAEPSNIKSCTPKPSRRKKINRRNLVLGVQYEKLSGYEEDLDESEFVSAVDEAEGVDGEEELDESHEDNGRTSFYSEPVPGLDYDPTDMEYVDAEVDGMTESEVEIPVEEGCIHEQDTGVVENDEFAGDSENYGTEYVQEEEEGLRIRGDEVPSPTRIAPPPYYGPAGITGSPQSYHQHHHQHINQSVPSTVFVPVSMPVVPTIGSSVVPPLHLSSNARTNSRSNSITSVGSFGGRPGEDVAVVSAAVPAVGAAASTVHHGIPAVMAAPPVSPIRMIPRMPRPQHMDFHVQEHSTGFVESVIQHPRSGSFDEPPVKGSSHGIGRHGYQQQTVRSSPRGSGSGSQKFFSSPPQPSSGYRNMSNQASYHNQRSNVDDGVGVYEDKSVPPAPLKFGMVSGEHVVDEVAIPSGGGSRGGSRRGSFNHHVYNHEDHSGAISVNRNGSLMGPSSSNINIPPYDELSSPKRSKNIDYANQDFSYRGSVAGNTGNTNHTTNK